MQDTVVCRLFGHKWEKRPVESLTDVKAVVGVCSRCGSEAKVWEVIGLGGRDVPSRLVDQDDVDKLKAMYRDGKIGEEKFEAGVKAALGDDSELEELMENE